MKKKILAAILAFCMALTPVSLSGTPVAQAAQAAETVTIDATEYGADPTGQMDSTRAIQDALAAAKEAQENGAPHVTVTFPEGEYQIYKDYATQREYHTSNTNSIQSPIKTIGILIEDQEGLTLDGNGSLFMMHGNMMALAVVNSKNITLKDFAWDFSVPTVSEMTITELGTEDGHPYTDFYIPACCPYEIKGTTLQWHSEPSPETGDYYWTETGIHNAYSVVATHPDEGMTRAYFTSESPFNGVNNIRTLDDSHIRITYQSSRPAMQKKGMILEFASSAYRETAGAFTWESENVTAQNVDVHFMHGFGWLVQMSTDVYYYDCDFMPREGSGHVTVSYADGIHASGASGDFVIENCNFSHTHDDPINLHGTFTRVEQKTDDHTLTLKYIHTQQGGFPQFHEGDKVAFFTRDTLESTDNETLYTVDEVISNPGESGNDLRTMRVRFKETLPANLTDQISGQPKYVAENVTYTPKVTIRGCTFKDVPTRGILCTTRQPVLIEDNVFYNMSMATIYLSNDSDEWYESGPIRDMTIRGNTFYIKSIGRTSWEYAPAVYVNPVTKGKGLPSADNPIHKNITIEENTFYMDTDTVVKAESVENLSIRNNKIMRANPVSIRLEASEAQEDGTARLLEGTSMGLSVDAQWKRYTKSTENAYEFTKCKNVTLEGNTYDDGLKLYAVLSGMPDEYLNNLDPDIQIAYDRNQPAKDPTGEIQFASSSPDVLSVNKYGQMTGLKPGKATVYAYFAWNGTQILSNEISVTVAGKSELDPADTVTIKEPAKTPVLTEKNATFSFSADIPSGKPITWAVEDFLTKGATDAATISQDGTVTALKNGIVWVRASAGLSADRKALIISLSETNALSPDFTILREDSANYSIESGKITIDMQNGDLYQETNTVPNLFLYSLPDQLESGDMRAVIKIDNLPLRENSQWDTASFLLYKDDDNYISVGKKSHFNGITTVSEAQGIATETGGDSAQNELDSAWLGFYKNGNTVSVDFKADGGTWQHVRDLPADMLGNDFKLGFTAWESNDRGKTASFSELRAGAGSLSYEDLCKQPAILFMEQGNHAPVVSEASFDKPIYETGDLATVRYSYTDPDNDTEGDSRYCFTFANGIQFVTDTPSITVMVPGEIRCQVYAADQKGRPATDFALAAATAVEKGVPAAKAALSSEIQASSAIDLSIYTTETASAFQHALEAAKACAGNANASLSMLQNALNTLREAKANLKPASANQQDGNGTQTPNPVVKNVPKKGTVFTYKNIQYKVTRSDAKNGTVTAMKLKGKAKAKITIPEKVTKNGYSFRVVSIEKGAFAKNQKLTTLVIGKNVSQIGAQAFKGCTKLKSISFQCKKAPKIKKNAFDKTKKGCKVYVGKNMTAKQFRLLKKRMNGNGIKQGKYTTQ